MEHWQGFATALAAFAVGGVSLVRGGARLRLLGAVALAAGLYVLSLALLFSTQDMRLSPVVIATGAALLGAGSLFARGYAAGPRRRHLAGLAPLAVVVALAWTDLFVAGSRVDPETGKLVAVHGPAGPALLAVVLAYFVSTWVAMWRAVRRTRGTERQQARVVLAALSLLLASVLVCNVALPVLGMPALNSVTGVALLVFLGLATYALISPEVFDVSGVAYRVASHGTVPAGAVLGGLAGIVLARVGGGALAPSATAAAALVGCAAGALLAQGVLPASRAYAWRKAYPSLPSPAEAREMVAGVVGPLLGTRELRAGVQGLLVHLHAPGDVEVRDAPARSYVAAGSAELVFGIAELATYVLGSRRSGDPYSSADADLAAAVLPQLAAAAARAREHDEVAVELASRTGEVRELRAGERRLVADVAHGLQTPLAVLRAEVDSAPDLASPVRRRFLRALDELAGSVRSLITYARAGVPLDEAQSEDVALDRLLADLAEYVETVAADRRVALRVELESVFVAGRRADLLAMATNLVGNALEHAGRGSGVHEVFIKLVASPVSAELTVGDTGPGMTPAERVRAFEPLFRGTGSREGLGMGLGLAIARQVAEAHGGAIEMRPREGGGTEVLVSLPALRR